jgi:hypothetical protein
MVLSSEQVRRFLLDIINQGAYRGDSIEFVLSVKQEVESATVPDWHEEQERDAIPLGKSPKD